MSCSHGPLWDGFLESAAAVGAEAACGFMLDRCLRVMMQHAATCWRGTAILRRGELVAHNIAWLSISCVQK